MRDGASIRKLSIVRTLATGLQYDPAVLAAAYGVTLRTIRRDIQALGTAGFPVFFVDNEDTPHRRMMVYMDRDWISHCPGPQELPAGRILDPEDSARTMNGTLNSKTGIGALVDRSSKLAHEVSTLRHTLIAHGIPETVPAPPETCHYLCSCGHHIEKQGTNGSTKVLGGKRGCPSCASWIRNLENGIL